MAKKKILIIGGGPAGQLTVTHLQKRLDFSKAEVTIVNKHDYSFATAKLHQTAAGMVGDESISIDMDYLSKGITFIKDTVVSVDIEKREVKCEKQTLSYDILVSALGAEPQTFGTPGVYEHGKFIWTRNSSKEARDMVEENCKKWQEDKDPSRLVVACVGAGFTGIEYLGEMVYKRRELAKKYGFAESEMKLVCIEGMNEVFPAMPEKVRKYTMKFMEKNNVEMRLGTLVESCDAEGLNLKGGDKLLTRNIIWAAGVKGNSIMAATGLETFGRTERVVVTDMLNVKDHPEVYVIGDASACIDERYEDGRIHLPTAQVGLQQGACVGDNLSYLINGKPEKQKPYKLIYRGTVCSLGPKTAVGLVYGVYVSGCLGHFFKWVIDMRYYFEVKGLGLTFKMMFKDKSK